MKLELVALLSVVCVAVDSMTVGGLETRTDGGGAGGVSIEMITGDAVVEGGGGAGDDGNERSSKDSGRRKRSGETAEDRAIFRQVRQLLKMKCKPRLVKVPVADELEEMDHRKDKHLMPKVLAVKRCIPSCSYCGNDFGLEGAECVSVRHKKKNFTVKYFEHGEPKYFKLRIRVDRKCRCQ